MGGRTIAGILADASTVLAGIVLIRLVGILVFRVLLPAVRMVTARIVEDLVTTALMIAWGLVWLRLAGVDLGSLITTSAVITGVVAFSMQETLGNILGGVVLQLDQSIRVGDWIKVDETSGKVVEIRWRYTAVETRNRETVVIPNGWLMKNRFTLVGSRADPSPLWRRWLWFELDVAHPPHPGLRDPREVGDRCRHPERGARPPPTAVLMKVEHGIGRYALRYFLDDPRPDDVTDSVVRAHALASLTRHNIPIAAPREERLLIKDNEAHRAAAARQGARPAPGRARARGPLRDAVGCRARRTGRAPDLRPLREGRHDHAPGGRGALALPHRERGGRRVDRGGRASAPTSRPSSPAASSARWGS